MNSMDDVIIVFCHVFAAIVVIRLFFSAYRSWSQRVQARPVPGVAETAGNTLLSPTSSREQTEEFARQMRNSAANRRVAERHGRETDDRTEDECCVCLCEAQAAVEFLRCGHTFCGKCALQLWEHGGVVRQMLCPLDRCPVEAIVPEYKMREKIQRKQRTGAAERLLSRQEVQQIDAKLAQYNTHNPQRSARGVLRLAMRSLSLARFMPLLIQAKIFLLFVLPILYTLSPIDLIPELIFGVVGYLDDLVIILVALVALANISRRMLGEQD